jgi:hypothetical protein
MKRVGHGKGQGQPNRTSPPHSAVSKASMPSAMRGKRTLLSICNTFHELRVCPRGLRGIVSEYLLFGELELTIKRR